MEGRKYSTTCGKCEYRSFLFSNLQKSDLSLVNLNRTEKDFTAGEIIVRQGEKITDFMYLKNGLLKISRENEKGKNQIVGLGRPMDFIGLLNIFSENRYQFTISALEESSLCFIDIELMKKIIRRDGYFALKLLEKMSSMHDMIMNNMLVIDQKNLRGRVAFILLMFSREIYQNEKFSLPVSRKEIGELINMRTENVIRILSELRKDNIIKIEGKDIHIVENRKLFNIAEFG